MKLFSVLFMLAMIGGGAYAVQYVWNNPDAITKTIIKAHTEKNPLPHGGVETPRTKEPIGAYTPYFHKNTVRINERAYTYYTYGPPGAAASGAKFPLVLVLHGAPGNAYAAGYLAKAGKQYPAFILAPVLSAGQYWALPDGHKTGLLATIEMIRDFATRNPVDMSRVYVIGCSDGGTGVFGAARHFPDIFAAGVAVAGTWDPQDAPNMTTMPLWAVHGLNDTIIPFEPADYTIKTIQSRGGKARMFPIPDMGHECPSERFYIDAMWQWMFAQRLSPAPAPAAAPPAGTARP